MEGLYKFSLFTKNGLSALQFKGVFASAQAVDEVTQLFHMLHPPSHHHVLMDQVRLWQVCSSLHKHTQLHYHILAH